MPKILTPTTDGLPAEPVEDQEVQQLIERVDDARESLHKSLHSIYDRELVIYREHDGRDDEGPRVRCVADVSLCNLNLRKELRPNCWMRLRTNCVRCLDCGGSKQGDNQ